MSYLSRILLFACLLAVGPAMAQQGASYPDAQALRTTLTRLTEEYKTGFQNIKGGLIEKKRTVYYYAASVHIVPADTPKICEDTDPMQVYYMDFVAKGLTADQSKEAYQKWKDLIKQALPGCSIQPDGSQYPDLESYAIASADGGTRFTLYRNGTGNGCQVSLIFMRRSWQVSPPSTPDYATAAAGKKVQSVDAEGVHIDGDQFARQLGELLSYAKPGFTKIRGTKDPSNTVVTYSTTYRLNGALSQVITDFPFLGICYTATYMENTTDSRGNLLFEQLRNVVRASLPAGFVDEGIKNDSYTRFATFSAEGQTLTVEIGKSELLHKITVSVRYKKKY